MYSYYELNLNIGGKGGVVASPDTNITQTGGSYYYHWERDGALSMRAYMVLNNLNLDAIETNMQAYVDYFHRKLKFIKLNTYYLKSNFK